MSTATIQSSAQRWWVYFTRFQHVWHSKPTFFIYLVFHDDPIWLQCLTERECYFLHLVMTTPVMNNRHTYNRPEVQSWTCLKACRLPAAPCLSNPWILPQATFALFIIAYLNNDIYFTLNISGNKEKTFKHCCSVTLLFSHFVYILQK